MSEGDPSDEARKGIGAYISYIVLGGIAGGVLGIAYHLHAFWWQ